MNSSTPQTSSVTVNRVSLPLGALIAGKITKVNLDVEQLESNVVIAYRYDVQRRRIISSQWIERGNTEIEQQGDQGAHNVQSDKKVQFGVMRMN